MYRLVQRAAGELLIVNDGLLRGAAFAALSHGGICRRGPASHAIELLAK